ncbi:uncharacterized protein PV09_07458 [Verruconis gallopava]|uniref:Chalcone isomerase domain-containing protein n=1 Tax=Verruconis gallopava TaxID=253628 RepID=A0A0D2APT2_9PEZI|nr:uncharacterized protein PV09_07458 [Verruconis gallopava]KIW01174.1 hypothetical protein PV09_07458 [Verruconis gallopava]
MSAPSLCNRLANRRLLFQSIFSIRSRSSHLARQQVRPARGRNYGTSRYGNPKHADFFEGTSRNPMDNISVDPVWAAQRAKDIRQMRYLALGLVCTIAATGITTMLYPAPAARATSTKESDGDQNRNNPGLIPRASMDAPGGKEADEFQGKPIVVIAGGQRVIAKDESNGVAVELVKTGTSTVPHFPKTITLPTSDSDGGEEEYTLLGLGIRSVSFLGMQVYVVGMYVQTSSLAALQARLVKYINPLGSALIANEKDELKNALLDSERSQQIWDQLLGEKELGLKSAFRIVPVRNTDFGHLRDGWVRGITSRTQDAQRSGDARFSDDSFRIAMKDFKDIMQGKGKAPTGSVILLMRDADGAMRLFFQNKNGKMEDFGSVKDERIARLVWLGYLGGKHVSSEPARKAIVDGIMELVERPIGSVETKVG